MKIFNQYHEGAVVYAVSGEVEEFWTSLDSPGSNLCPTDYEKFKVSGYLNWLLPIPEDFVALISWRVTLRGERNKLDASTDPRPFLQHLIRATKTKTVTGLAQKIQPDALGLATVLRQYVRPLSAPGPYKNMSVGRLRLLIGQTSIQKCSKINKNRNSLLRPSETGSMLRVLAQDELYARVGLAWKLRYRKKQDVVSPTFKDLPWLLASGTDIANKIWARYTNFERRCIIKLARHRKMANWGDS